MEKTTFQIGVVLSLEKFLANSLMYSGTKSISLFEIPTLKYLSHYSLTLS